MFNPSESKETLTRVVERMERLEKKLDLLNMTLREIEGSLNLMKPILKALNKLPLVK
jgi:chaperonin cofactor prefoldin